MSPRLKRKIINNGLLISFCLGIILILFFCFGLFQQHQFAKNRLLELQDTVTFDNVGDKKALKIKDTSETINYEIEDGSVAKIDESGNLVAVGEGETKIKITNEDNTKKQIVTIKVEDSSNKNSSNKNNNSNKQSSTGTLNNSSSNQNNTTNNSNSLNNSSSSAGSSSGSNNNSSNTNIPSIPSGNTNNSNNSSNTSSGSSNSSNNSSSSNSSGSSNSSANTTVRVNGVSLNKTSETINLNSSSKSFTVLATVSPYNASNKGVNWSTSNSSVATVGGGVVTAKNPGTATITVTTQDGNKSASMTVKVTKKVIIVIGASQVTRMNNVDSYTSSNNYKKSDGSLVYIANGGSGIQYQYDTGLASIKNVMNNYNSAKGQTQFYVFFPLSGNTIKGFSCDQISSDNASIKEYARGYNNAIQLLKNSGYKVNGYVVSMHPVKTSQATSSYVVTNENSNACASGYRSNYKYYQFNRAIKSRVEANYSANLKYLSLFIKIMDVGDGSRHNFSFKNTISPYNTTDGIHWDESTTRKYVNLMLSTAGV